MSGDPIQTAENEEKTTTLQPEQEISESDRLLAAIEHYLETHGNMVIINYEPEFGQLSKSGISVLTIGDINIAISTNIDRTNHETGRDHPFAPGRKEIVLTWMAPETQGLWQRYTNRHRFTCGRVIYSMQEDDDGHTKSGTDTEIKAGVKSNEINRSWFSGFTSQLKFEMLRGHRRPMIPSDFIALTELFSNEGVIHTDPKTTLATARMLIMFEPGSIKILTDKTKDG